MRLRGFSLIEVVLAIGLVGTILIVFQAVLTSQGLVRTTAFEGTALKIAQSQLDALRHGGYGALPASGPIADADLSLLPESAETVTVSDFNAGTKRVTVSVSWDDPRAGARTVSLTTLVATSGGLP